MRGVRAHEGHGQAQPGGWPAALLLVRSPHTYMVPAHWLSRWGSSDLSRRRDQTPSPEVSLQSSYSLSEYQGGARNIFSTAKPWLVAGSLGSCLDVGPGLSHLCCWLCSLTLPVPLLFLISMAGSASGASQTCGFHLVWDRPSQLLSPGCGHISQWIQPSASLACVSRGLAAVLFI